MPRLPGVVEVGGSGRLPVLTTNRFEPAMVSVCNDLGVTVQAVDTMTLEEILLRYRNQQQGTAYSMND
jgi:ABC-2 type transport system ATP-binding protein